MGVVHIVCNQYDKNYGRHPGEIFLPQGIISSLVGLIVWQLQYLNCPQSRKPPTRKGTSRKSTVRRIFLPDWAPDMTWPTKIKSSAYHSAIVSKIKRGPTYLFSKANNYLGWMVNEHIWVYGWLPPNMIACCHPSFALCIFEWTHEKGLLPLRPSENVKHCCDSWEPWKHCLFYIFRWDKLG